MNKVTFLSKEQACGDEQGNGQLEVLKKYSQVEFSDLAIMLGGLIVKSETNKNKSGLLWTSSPDGKGNVCLVDQDGKISSGVAYARNVGARPALPPSLTSEIIQEKPELEFKRSDDGLTIVEYGEYPQTVVSKEIAKQLEADFKNGSLHTTGREYTFDSTRSNFFHLPFREEKHVEYSRDKKKYIRVKMRNVIDCGHVVLSNEQLVKASQFCWIEVKPIEWLVETDGQHKGWWVAKQALFAGVPFYSKRNIDDHRKYNGNLENTFISEYLNNYFLQEIGKTQQRKSVVLDSGIDASHATRVRSQTSVPNNGYVDHDLGAVVEAISQVEGINNIDPIILNRIYAAVTGVLKPSPQKSVGRG